MRRFEERYRAVLSGAFGVLLALVGGAAEAEVTSSAPGGFVLKIELPLAVSPGVAFDRFAQIGRWWSDEHTYSGRAANMTLELKPGGCFCETLEHGGFVRHAAVEYAQRGAAIRLSGALGPLQQIGAYGMWTLQFKADGANTKLVMSYTVSGYPPDKGYTDLAPAVDAVMRDQMARFKKFAEASGPVS